MILGEALGLEHPVMGGHDEQGQGGLVLVRTGFGYCSCGLQQKLPGTEASRYLSKSRPPEQDLDIGAVDYSRSCLGQRLPDITQEAVPLNRTWVCWYRQIDRVQFLIR